MNRKRLIASIGLIGCSSLVISIYIDLGKEVGRTILIETIKSKFIFALLFSIIITLIYEFLFSYHLKKAAMTEFSKLRMLSITILSFTLTLMITSYFCNANLLDADFEVASLKKGFPSALIIAIVTSFFQEWALKQINH